MASCMLDGAVALTFSKGRTLTGLAFAGTSLNGMRPSQGLHSAPRCRLSSSRPHCISASLHPARERGISVLPIPLRDKRSRQKSWPLTDDMRDEALEPADLYDPRLKVVDVSGGTEFAAYTPRISPFSTSPRTN